MDVLLVSGTLCTFNFSLFFLSFFRTLFHRSFFVDSEKVDFFFYAS